MRSDQDMTVKELLGIIAYLGSIFIVSQLIVMAIGLAPVWEWK